MARHVEFGNDHDVAIGCIGNDLLDLFLGVERSGRFRVVPVADSPFGGQLRITLDLDAQPGSSVRCQWNLLSL